jgi:hypothetical protein
MRICVDQPVKKNLFQIRAKEFSCQTRTIDLHKPERTQFSDLLARDVVHCEDPGSCEIVDRLRDDHSFKLSQVLSEGYQIVRFEFEIQLAQQSATQTQQQVAEFVALADLSMLVEEVGNFFEGLEVFNDLVANVRSLHLYDDRAAVAHGSQMHLGQ